MNHWRDHQEDSWKREKNSLLQKIDFLENIANAAKNKEEQTRRDLNFLNQDLSRRENEIRQFETNLLVLSKSNSTLKQVH